MPHIAAWSDCEKFGTILEKEFAWWPVKLYKSKKRAWMCWVYYRRMTFDPIGIQVRITWYEYYTEEEAIMLKLSIIE